MTPLRITRCKEIVQHWDFFRQGLLTVREYLHYPYTLDEFRRVLFRLSKLPDHGFVMMILDDDGNPLCFGAAFDCTPVYASNREFDIPFLFHQPAHIAATAVLRREFEKFCRAQRVKRYYMTTTTFNGHAQKCFPRYGFQRSHVVFKRELK